MPFLNLDDTEIHYDVAGQGPAFIFNSATAWHSEPWKLFQVPEFSKDHTVITFDQRGTGQSTTTSTDFSTRRLAADAAAVLDHLKMTDAIVLGHSNGGRVAMTLAADYPHLVSKLILASSGAAYNGPPGIPMKMCVELVKKGYERYVRDHTFDVGFVEGFYEAHKELCDTFVNTRMANLPTLEAFLGHVVNRQDSDVMTKLGKIQVPTLVMVGEDEDHHATDMTHLASAKLLADEIARAKLVIIPGQGHYYAFVDSERTNAIIREFLGSSH